MVIVDRGTGVMFHSDRSFINEPASEFSICTASAIWRSIASFLYEPVTNIWKSCSSPLCSSRQCRHNGELAVFLAARSVRCLCPRVYALDAVSPLYFFFLQSSPRHSILYVTLSVWHLPLLEVVQTKQSILSQPPSLKGLEVCSWLFSIYTC